MISSISLKQVDQEILAAIKALEVEYNSNDALWLCPSNPINENIPGSGNIIVSEAIMCYLLPLSFAGSNSSLSKEIFRIVSRDKLRDRILKHLKRFKSRDDYTGDPYLIIKDYEDNTFPFLDSYCFVLSIVVLYGQIFGEPKNKDDRKVLIDLFADSLKFIENCAVKNVSNVHSGFFATDTHIPETPYKYPTWMAVDTLSDLDGLIDGNSFLLGTSETKNKVEWFINSVLPQIKGDYIRKYIDADLTNSELQDVSERNLMISKGLLREDEDDNSPHYNLWAIVILLYLEFKSTKTLSEAFKIISPYILDDAKFRTISTKKCEIAFFSEQYKLGDENENILSDRCFLPQFVKGLAIFLKSFPNVSEASELEGVFEQAYDRLMKNRKDDQALWDRFAENDAPYAIYQTERAIEALCHTRNLFSDASKPTSQSKDRPKLSSDTDEHLATILKHAISINIQGKDARGLIEREVKASVEVALRDIRNEFEQKLLQSEDRLQQVLEDTLKSSSDGKVTKSTAQRVSELGREAGITKK